LALFSVIPAENYTFYVSHSFILIQCVGRTGGRIQQQAGSALLDVATSGSGAAGCARASADEIDSLLAALQNPSAVVRDAALRVSVIQIQFLAVGYRVYHGICIPSSLC
jgi:hypothetical protein